VVLELLDKEMLVEQEGQVLITAAVAAVLEK
jgi:hypothetical protein